MSLILSMLEEWFVLVLVRFIIHFGASVIALAILWKTIRFLHKIKSNLFILCGWNSGPCIYGAQ